MAIGAIRVAANSEALADLHEVGTLELVRHYRGSDLCEHAGMYGGRRAMDSL